MRLRSPITSHENYALKLKLGYAIHPSQENDSYYFIHVLTHHEALSNQQHAAEQGVHQKLP